MMLRNLKLVCVVVLMGTGQVFADDPLNIGFTNPLPSGCEPWCQGSIELVFVVDSSGSMYDFEIPALCGDGGSPGAIQFTLEDLNYVPYQINATVMGTSSDVVCHDFPGGGNVSEDLGTLVPGNDPCELSLAESWSPATAIVAERHPWPNDALRIIIPVSDDSPCDGCVCEDTGADRDSIDNTIAIAHSNQVIVSPLTFDRTAGGCLHQDDQVITACFKELATDLADGTTGIASHFAIGSSSSDVTTELVNTLASVLQVACGDCDFNDIHDLCELAGNDCNDNEVLDGCERDCNRNGQPDDCDLASGHSEDCNANQVPDECDVSEGTSSDCNSNNQPDECDITSGTSMDCDVNEIPDECEPPQAECRFNIGTGTFGATALGFPAVLDPDWTITSSPLGGAASAYTVYHPAYAIPVDAEWISHYPTNGSDYFSGPGGAYTYEIEFIAEPSIDHTVIDMDVAADNRVQLFINGSYVTTIEGYASLQHIEVSNQAFFQDGLNTLTAVVDNDDLWGPTALFIRGWVYTDWDFNGMMDGDCFLDCNGNGIPDYCAAYEVDCNSNDVPDDCEEDVHCN